MNLWAFLFWHQFLEHPEMFCALLWTLKELLQLWNNFQKSWNFTKGCPRLNHLLASLLNTKKYTDTSTLTMMRQGGNWRTHRSVIQVQYQSCPRLLQFWGFGLLVKLLKEQTEVNCIAMKLIIHCSSYIKRFMKEANVDNGTNSLIQTFKLKYT